MITVAVPDLISNSYFPVVAAATLGVFAEEGLQVSAVHIAPLTECVRALGNGSVDFIGASAHAPLLAFPNWQGVKLLCAQSQGTYWFLVMRKDLNVARGDIGAVKGRRIAAVPFVGMALRRMFVAAGLADALDELDLVVPEAARKPGVNFGVAAVEALADGSIDGFFANGMGAEIAVVRGIGDIVLDVRRGDGPAESFGYTCPAVATTDALIREKPAVAAAFLRGLVRVQRMLKQDPSLAARVGEERFPEFEAGLITDVVKRDLPNYQPALSEAFIESMCRYARETGMPCGFPRYEEVVATEFTRLWDAA